MDLLKKMLSRNPKDRPLPHTALMHDFFKKDGGRGKVSDEIVEIVKKQQDPLQMKLGNLI